MSGARVPLYSLIALIVFIVALVLLLIFGDTSNGETITIISVMLANIPGLVASFMAERNSNAITNGVVTQKAKEGATQALQESGVTDAVQNSPATTAAFVSALNTHSEALTQILNNWKEAPPHGTSV